MINRYQERLRPDIKREMVMFDFANIDEISRKVRQVEQELRQQIEQRCSSQAKEFIYRKGPDSNFNRTAT